MADFVLIHGAWHGSWFWKRVRPHLSAQGHSVFAPTLTGLADRSHLLMPEVGLRTHVADVCNLLAYEELGDVVLVGHSYGGIIARHVADAMAERVRSLVFLDAFVTEDRRPLSDYLPDGGAQFREQAERYGEGWKIPPIPASNFGLRDAEDVAWVDSLCTMHPLSTVLEPAFLSGACDTVAKIQYVLSTGFPGPFSQFHDYAKEMNWQLATLPCGHEVALDMPEELTNLLIQAL